jgi:hypothetical protein
VETPTVGIIVVSIVPFPGMIDAVISIRLPSWYDTTAGTVIVAFPVGQKGITRFASSNIEKANNPVFMVVKSAPAL